MSKIIINRSKNLDNIIDSPIVRMEGVKEAAGLFGLPKNLIRNLALEGKIKAVRIGNGKNAKILVNIQSLNDYFNNAVINHEEQEVQVSGIQPIPVEI